MRNCTSHSGVSCGTTESRLAEPGAPTNESHASSVQPDVLVAPCSHSIATTFTRLHAQKRVQMTRRSESEDDEALGTT